MRLVDRLLERCGRWLGIEPGDDLASDPLLARPLDHPVLDRVSAALAERDDCPHWSSTGIDTTHPDDLEKIWRCDGCGLTYRNVVDPERPWYVLRHEPVEVS